MKSTFIDSIDQYSRGGPIELIQGEHRTVFTHQFLSDAASAAHAESTFHAIFQAHDNVIVGVPQFFQYRLGEFDHDGRSAYDGIGVITALGRLLFRDGGNEAHIVLPVGIIRAIHGDVHIDVVPFFPRHQFVLVEQHVGRSGTVHYVDIAEFGSIGRIEHIYDGGAKGGKGEPAANDEDVFPFQKFPGIRVAERPPNPHDVPDPHFVQVGGDDTGAIHGELDEPFFHGRRRNTDGNFPRTGDGEFGKLARPICKVFFVTIVEENEFECLETLVLGLDGDIVDADRIG